MSDDGLYRELSRKLCKDLGATPFSLKKTGLTHPDLAVRSSMKIQDEKGVVKRPPMWYGEALGAEGLMCCLLVALDDDPDSLEVACTVGFKDVRGNLEQDAIRLGFRYDWSDEADTGTLVMQAGDKWLPVSLSQRLQIALGFENMVQDGTVWEARKGVPEELQKNLSEIIEVDS
jgi:hypothetical protein